MRIIKNYLCKGQGFSCCPNCGDSYGWKPTGSLPFEEDSAVGFSGRSENGKLVLNIGIKRSVLLCVECLEKPDGLDNNRIAVNLEKSGWEQGDIDKVLRVIAELQTQQVA